MTDQPFDAVVELARSWSTPPAVKVSGDHFEGLGFDRAERAFRFVRRGAGDELVLDIDASETSPLKNVAIVIDGWGDAPVAIEVDGRRVPRGDDFRYGYERTLDDTRLVVWLFHAATGPTRIRLSKAARAQ